MTTRTISQIAAAQAFIRGGRKDDDARLLGEACGWDRDAIDSALYEAWDPVIDGYHEVMAHKP